MKKSIAVILSTLLILSVFAGCGKKADPASGTDLVTPQVPASEAGLPDDDQQTIRLAALKGPTAMGLVKLIDNAAKGEADYAVDSNIYGAADEITALLADGKLDMAAIPCNLAAVLASKPEIDLQVAAINTLGVLYVIELGNSVSSIEDLRGKTVYSTGKGTTPEYSLNAILSANGIDPANDLSIDFKSEATEIAALLTGESAVPGTIAVLPQPYATTVLVGNPDARIALSLDEEWVKAQLPGRTVTGVLVVSREFAENNSQLVNDFLSDYNESVSWANENVDEAAELIAAAGIVAKAPVAAKALPYCSLVFISGADMKADVSAYLDVLYQQNPKSVGGALPDDSFYYGA